MVNGKFETINEVREYLSDNKIECLECGRRFKALNLHLIARHDTTVRAYQDKYGIPHKYGLVSLPTKEKQAENLKRRVDEGSLVRPTDKIREIGKRNKGVTRGQQPPAHKNATLNNRVSTKGRKVSQSEINKRTESFKRNLNLNADRVQKKIKLMDAVVKRRDDHGLSWKQIGVFLSISEARARQLYKEWLAYMDRGDMY